MAGSYPLVVGPFPWPAVLKYLITSLNDEIFQNLRPATTREIYTARHGIMRNMELIT